MLSKNKKSIALVQGVVKDTLFDRLKGKKVKDIFVLEGRPKLKAAKSLTKELIKRHVTPTLIADNMAGVLFYKDLIKEVWLSYQVADKQGAICDIGALIVAVLGKRHNVPVYLYPAGHKTKLLGSSKDILTFNGKRTTSRKVQGYAPLVEWVPKKYITKIYDNN